MESIKTERLILRRFQYSDAEPMFLNWASDEEVTKYVTWDKHQSVDTTKQLIDLWIKEYDDPKTVRFAVVLKSNNELIGGIDVVRMNNNVPEIGYVLARKYWGQGYMSEACLAFTNYLFSLGYQELNICADVNNIASNRVIQKCGFSYTHQEVKEYKEKKITVNWYKKQKAITY